MNGQKTIIQKKDALTKAAIRIQSVMLDKNIFTTTESATSYVDERLKMDVDRLDEIGDFFTFGQLAKDRFVEPLQEFHFGKGVVALVGTFKDSPEKIDQSGTVSTTIERVRDFGKLSESTPSDETLRKIERIGEQHKSVVASIEENNQKVIDYLNEFGSLVGQVGKTKEERKLSSDYLIGVLSKAKQFLPPDLFDEIQRFSTVYASGNLERESSEELNVEKKESPNEIEGMSPEVAAALAAIGGLKVEQGSTDTSGSRYSAQLSRRLEKGFLNGDPEGGPHSHTLDRNKKATHKDGAHPHLFVFNDVFFLTEEDGEHSHTLESSNAEEAGDATSVHQHKVILPQDIELEDGKILKAGTELLTEEGGNHPHELMIETTGFSGIHPHTLKLPDNTVLTSFMPGEFFGKFPFDMSNLPSMPKASEITRGLEGKTSSDVDTSVAKSMFTKIEEQDVDNVWKWGQEKIPLLIEPASIGHRSLVRKSGDKVTFIYETPAENHSFDLSQLTEFLKTIDQDFVLDGYIMVEKTAPILSLIDLQELGQSVKDLPVSSRKKLLKNFFSAYLLGNEEFELVPSKEINSPAAFTDAIEWARTESKVGAAIAKSSDGTYSEAAEWKQIANQSEVPLSIEVAIQKIDKEKRFVFGVVLEPDTIDAQGDIISSEQIKKTSYEFMKDSGTVGLNHQKKINAVVIHNEIVQDENAKRFGSPVKKGSWFMGVYVGDDKVWPDVRSGKLNSFSIGGSGIRTPIKADSPA